MDNIIISVQTSQYTLGENLQLLGEQPMFNNITIILIHQPEGSEWPTLILQGSSQILKTWLSKNGYHQSLDLYKHPHLTSVDPPQIPTEIKTWKYELPVGNTLWSSLDYGVLEAETHDLAMSKAILLITEKLITVNKVLDTHPNTTGTVFNMDLKELKVIETIPEIINLVRVLLMDEEGNSTEWGWWELPLDHEMLTLKELFMSHWDIDNSHFRDKQGRCWFSQQDFEEEYKPLVFSRYTTDFDNGQVGFLFNFDNRILKGV